MLIKILSLAILASASTAIVSHYRLKRSWFYLLKPLTTVLIAVLAWYAYYKTSQPYSFWVLASLPLALLGDILLVNYKHLKGGIAAFSMVHVGLILAIGTAGGFDARIDLLFPLLAFGLGFYVFLRKSLAGYSTLIGFYTLVILAMNWFALSLAFKFQTHFTIIVAAGSLLFTVSDSIIALNLFKWRFRLSELLILTTYWLAIYLLSVAPFFVTL